MMVPRKGVGDAVLLHDDEGDAIGEGPILIQALPEEFKAFLEQLLTGRDNGAFGVATQ